MNGAASGSLRVKVWQSSPAAADVGCAEMMISFTNRTQAVRIFYDSAKREIKVAPGQTRRADVDQGTYDKLVQSDLILGQPAPIPISQKDKSAIFVTGHFGIGDNLHQRAVMRELMKQNDVWLHTCHFELYHDLIAKGLKLILRPTGLHAQGKTILREQSLFADAMFPNPPLGARRCNIGYPKVLIDEHGSILEAMFSCVGLKMPERPDFSLPIKPEWRTAATQFDTGGKPLMVLRPIVIRKEWDGRSRNPDLKAYDELYRSIRDNFFVVSIADLAPSREWIDGPEQEVDVKLHAGELSFPEMAALFASADLVFCNAGFAPVLAQAVGTPVAVVYGGRESFRTTQRIGTHLAPTLPIDPINPCDCHANSHGCDKRIDVPKALEALADFIEKPRDKSTLLFGTFYIDSPDRDQLTDLWIKLHTTLNPDCDFLAVDSQSPIQKFVGWTRYDGRRRPRMYFNFDDNIGHLSRRLVTQGRDGWGRAFCKGLEIAVKLGYEYAAHIEGDSLFRLSVSNITEQMKLEGIDCVSAKVNGLINSGAEHQWVETGLMMLSTDYLRRSNFIQRYDWPNRRVTPTPERFIRQNILERDLNKNQFRIMPWRAWRADKNKINKNNIISLNLDWITHQHDSGEQDVYRRFVDHALNREEVVESKAATNGSIRKENVVDNVVPQPGTLAKLNLGCGTNRLAGWSNHDKDVDITKPLPWKNNTAGYIAIEHCVEHVPYKQALEFFKEARRVLAPGGVLRVTVPSLQQIAACDEADYWQFTTKWQNRGSHKRGAMHAIIYSHGHETVWNAQMMRDSLFFAGFDDVRECQSGLSEDPQLRGIEGHGKVIGDKFNLIESCTHEARKDGKIVVADERSEVAVVIGGAECWQKDLDEALRLLDERPTRFFFVNDHIKSFPRHGIACTLHPDKLHGAHNWLAKRRQAGLPEPQEVWAHIKHASVTHDTATVDWQGSSGLFAVQVARRHGYDRVILCGVPMTVDDGHFERHQKWQSAITFRNGWVRCRSELVPFVRSMSGWTLEMFGLPTEEWLDKNGA
jgi:hypothetical protein